MRIARVLMFNKNTFSDFYKKKKKQANTRTSYNYILPSYFACMSQFQKKYTHVSDIFIHF